MKYKVLFILVFSLNTLFCQNNVDSLRYYYSKGQFEKAINYGEKQKSLTKIKDSNYVLLINNLASAYSIIGDAKNAELNYLEELELVKSFFGENDKIVAFTYRNLGNVYAVADQDKQAEIYFTKSLTILKNFYGVDIPVYADCLSDLATTYKNLGIYDKAENIFNEVCELKKKNFGVNSIIYHKALISKAMFYDKIGDIKKSDTFFLESYTLQKANLKKDTFLIFIEILNGIGTRYSLRSEYSNAEKFYLESLETTNKYIGKENTLYTNSLKELGQLYSVQSQYPQSRTYFNEASKILANLKKYYSSEHVFVLEALASGYRYEAKYDLSEQLYFKAIDINKKLNANSHDYINSIKLLAGNYLDKGDINNAEIYYLKTLELTKEKTTNEYLLDLFDVINFYFELKNAAKAHHYLLEADNLYNKLKNNLRQFDLSHYFICRAWGNYFLEIKDYKNAYNMFVKKAEITKSNPLFGNLSIPYSKDLTGLANACKNLGDFENYEKYYFQAFDIIKSKIGQNPRNDASFLLGLALVYQHKNDFKNAEKYFLQSLNMVEEKLNVSIPFYDDILFYASTFYFTNSLPSNSFTYLKKVFGINSSFIFNSLDFLNEREFENIRKDNDSKKNFPLSFLNVNPSQYPEINIGCFENELLLKNLSLRNQQRIKSTIEKSGDEAVKQKYQQFIDNKRYLTKLDELPIAQRPAAYEQLKTDTENLEKELTRLSSTFAEAKKSLAVTWKQIQDKLKPNEAAIDLVAFDYFDKKWTDKVIYGAFVIKKGMKFPKFITLFEQKQLQFALARIASDTDEKRINNNYTDKTISDLFYKPLEDDLKNTTTIYLAPTDLAHQINFKALPLLENQTFGERFEIKLVGSSASILDYKPTAFQETKDLELILYGGINYEKSTTSVSKEATDDFEPKVTSNKELETRSGIGKFNYLKGTNAEVKKIETVAKNRGFATQLFTETSATEEQIKSLSGKTTPFVLHLATHGFFFENAEKELPKEPGLLQGKSNGYKTSDDPMLRSGLLFAGANKFWRKHNDEKIEDGILTAKEISNLDLSACQLVVLSACETGLGQINGSEGVFGLQRAFKMAGVQNIIMSLWKVPDAQTSELFEIFYTECFKGNSIQEAFQTAQNQMKSKYDPYFWAGFVLLE